MKQHRHCEECKKVITDMELTYCSSKCQEKAKVKMCKYCQKRKVNPYYKNGLVCDDCRKIINKENRKRK